MRGKDERIATALRDAVDDLSTTNEGEVFRERMEAAADNEVKTMRGFLADLAKAETDLKVEVAAPEGQEAHSATASLPLLREAVRSLTRAPIVGKHVRTVVGELVGINLRTKKFELRTIENDERFVGGMAADIFNDLTKAVLPSRYRVVIEGAVRQTQYGKEKRGSWRMISAVAL